MRQNLFLFQDLNYLMQPHYHRTIHKKERFLRHYDIKVSFIVP